MNSQYSYADPMALKHILCSEVLLMLKSRLGTSDVGMFRVFYVCSQDSPVS